jgi:hypothetical protein
MPIISSGSTKTERISVESRWTKRYVESQTFLFSILMGIQVLESYEPLDEPDKNILTLHVFMFNTCFIQVFEIFNQLNNRMKSNTE